MRWIVAAAIALAPVSARADVAAVVGGDDVKHAVLVGPSAQVWEPDGNGTWTRSSEGGVAADVEGAMRVGSELVVGGRATPLFRREGQTWNALRIGERGRTVIGSGPRAALAVGKEVFVWTGSQWKRVATAARPIVAVWASSPTSVYAATDAEVLRLQGAAFVTQMQVAVRGFGSGGAAWAVTADGVVDVAGKRTQRPMIGNVAVEVARVAVAPDGGVWAVGFAGDQPALVHLVKNAWKTAAAPPVAAGARIVGLAVDKAGAILVVTSAGAVHVGAPDGTWSIGTVVDALPAAKTGPGPARADENHQSN